MNVKEGFYLFFFSCKLHVNRSRYSRQFKSKINTDQKLLRKKQDCTNSTWSKIEGLGLCATFNLEPEHLLSVDEEQILSAR